DVVQDHLDTVVVGLEADHLVGGVLAHLLHPGFPVIPVRQRRVQLFGGVQRVAGGVVQSASHGRLRYRDRLSRHRRAAEEVTRHKPVPGDAVGVTTSALGDPGVGELGLLGQQFGEAFGDGGLDLAAEQRNLHLDAALDDGGGAGVDIAEGDGAADLGGGAFHPRLEGGGSACPVLGARNDQVTGTHGGDGGGQQLGGD